jgi:hypothetical protein
LNPFITNEFAEARFGGAPGATHGTEELAAHGEIQRDFAESLTSGDHAFGVSAVARGAAIQAPRDGINQRRLATGHRAGNGEEVQVREIDGLGLSVSGPERHEVFEGEFLWAHKKVWKGWGQFGVSDSRGQFGVENSLGQLRVCRCAKRTLQLL